MFTNENLQEILLRTIPQQHPFISAIRQTKAYSPLHEWAIECEVIDGMLQWFIQRNRTQISRRTVDTKAGKDSNAAVVLAVVRKGVHLLRDIEAVLLSGQSKRKGSETIPALTGSIQSFIKTHVDASPDVPRPLTEDMLIRLLEAVPEASMVLFPCELTPTLKSFHGYSEGAWLSGGSYTLPDSERKVSLHPDRFMRSSDLFAICPDSFGLAWFRPITVVDLAPTQRPAEHPEAAGVDNAWAQASEAPGQANKLLICEYALECSGESKNGAIYNLN